MPRSFFICSYEGCSATFRHSSHYDSHLRMHAGERPFICLYDDCNKSYTSLAHLRRHEDTHENFYKCDYPNCAKILMSKATLQKHINIVHLKKISKTYKCTVCDQEFNKHNWLTAHMYTHTGIKPYECPEPGCDKRFLRPCKLKQHMKYHKGYPCDKPGCSETFPKWSLLRKHIKECHSHSHKCPSCDKVFKTTTLLKQHSLVHQEDREVFKCPMPKCIRFYLAKRHLVEHLKYFHKERSYSCPKDDCYRFCKTEEELMKHMNRRHLPRRRKPVHPKPSFAEILAGFAKGTPKDLNPHRYNTSKPDETNEELLKPSIEESDTNNEELLKPSIEDNEEKNSIKESDKNTESSITKSSISEISGQNYSKYLNPWLYNITKDKTCKQLETRSIEFNESNITTENPEASIAADCNNDELNHNFVSSTKDLWSNNMLHVKEICINLV